MKIARLVLAATCISAGLAHSTFGQQVQAPMYQPNAAEPRPLLARNLGVHYVPIRYGDGTIGLRLTAAPMPGSPASRLPLDAGDVIFALDGQRFTNLNDVANHVDRTTVDYVDAATNTRQRGMILLPPAAGPSQGPVAPQAPAMAMGGSQIGQQSARMAMRPPGQAGAGGAGQRPLFAGNLGIYYLPIRYVNGTIGLRLTAAPVAGSPASGLPLDAGDIIFALDSQTLANPSDVAKHFDQTTVDFVDVATNTRQRGVITLPPAGEQDDMIVGAPAAAGGGSQIGQSSNSNAGGLFPQTGPSASMGGSQIDQASNLTAGGPFGQAGARPGSPLAGQRPLFAGNLGIYYLPIRYVGGTMGLRLTAAPVAGSPASGIPLDAGDIIFALDGQTLANPSDVANHFDQTTVDFIDAASNTRQRGTITLPSQNR